MDATVCLGTWEGVEARRSASQETRLTDHFLFTLRTKGR